MATTSLGLNMSLIPKLEGSSNYENWKLLVTSSVEAIGVWKFIVGMAILPISYKGEEYTTI